MKLASACAIIRKMFRTTGILSKDARTSPPVAAGSIRGSLAIRLFLTFCFLPALRAFAHGPELTATARYAHHSASADFANGIGAVPTGGDLADMLEETPLAAADVGYFDHGAGMGLRIEIGKAALFTTDLAFVSHLIAKRQRPVVEGLIVAGPVRHVLQPFAAGVEKLLVHRGRVVALLDQFDLEIAGIGERHAHLHGGVLAAVAKVIGLDPIDIVPGPDAHHIDPVVHGGADIPHDVAVLADCTKDTAHDDLPSACRRNILSAHYFLIRRSAD